MALKHQPVLLEPALKMLNIQPGGIYVDATFGRGGHAAAILEQLGIDGRLYAIDRDLEAVNSASSQFSEEKRFAIRHGSFDMLGEFCNSWGITGKVDGILFDLGVSSPQLDDSSRGFSFMSDGPLDMRMNTQEGISAAEWLATAAEKEIADVIWRYGEERFSRRIARKIVQVRQEKPILTTSQLAQLISDMSFKKDKHKHPATRTFQAIRIFINRELEILEAVLEKVFEVLAPCGRLVIISFHSLEDRIVKRFIRDQARGEQLPFDLPIKESAIKRTVKQIGKAIKPSDTEVLQNARSRSAIMRVAEKIA